MAYKPQPGSLAHRVCKFFSDHPDESLSTSDIAIKFDIESAGSIPALLDAAVKAGALSSHKRGAERDFKTGHKLSDADLGQAGWISPISQKPAFPGKQPRKRRRVVDVPNPDTITIESSIAIPARRRSRGLDYTGLFARMKPGDSFKLSKDAAASILARAKAWGKEHNATFVKHDEDDTHARIWRKE